MAPAIKDFKMSKIMVWTATSAPTRKLCAQCIWGTGPWRLSLVGRRTGPSRRRAGVLVEGGRGSTRAHVRGEAVGLGRQLTAEQREAPENSTAATFPLDFLELGGNHFPSLNCPSGVHLRQQSSWSRLWRTSSSLKLSGEFQKCSFPLQEKSI